METTDFALEEIKFAGTQDGEFTGRAISFNSPISHPFFGTDIVKPGAFNRTLAERGTANIKMLWSHDVAQPIGQWTAMHETPGGLEVRGQLLLQLEKAKEVRALMQAGILDGLSIGFSVPADGADVDARRQVRTLKQIDLYEVSLVVFPADTKAKIREIKSERAGLGQLLEQIRQLRRLVRGWR